MERREPLVTARATEHQHARQDRVHGPHSLQGIVAQHHVEFRHADGHLVHRDQEHLLQQLRVCQLVFCHCKSRPVTSEVPLLRRQGRLVPSSREHFRLETPDLLRRLLNLALQLLDLLRDIA